MVSTDFKQGKVLDLPKKILWTEIIVMWGVYKGLCCLLLVKNTFLVESSPDILSFFLVNCIFSFLSLTLGLAFQASHFSSLLISRHLSLFSPSLASFEHLHTDVSKICSNRKQQFVQYSIFFRIYSFDISFHVSKNSK